MKCFLLFMMIFALISCQKGISDNTNSTDNSIDCDLLKQGLADANVTMIDASLGKLLDQQYSNENLNQLATKISAACDVTAVLTCFDCIKTNPPQSEMHFSFIIDGNSVQYVLNLTPATDNTIKTVSVN